MKIWQMKPDPDNHISLTLKNKTNDEYAQLRRRFNGTPIKRGWFPLEIIIKGKSKKASDLLHLWDAYGTFVLKEKALLSLQSFFEDCEILDLTSDNYRFYLINPLKIVDGLDKEKSKLTLNSSGNILLVEKHVLMAEKIKDVHIFKIPEQKEGHCFVSDEFRQTVIDNKLKGFIFEEISVSEKE